MRRILTVVCSFVCLLLVSVSSVGSYSYSQDSDSTVNKYTVGNANCSIVESLTKPSTYRKGTSFSNSVSVENTGNVPCYIRVHIAPKYSTSYSFNVSSSWSKDGDWYYYSKSVNPGDTTSPLYTTVTLNVDMTSWSANDMQIVKYAECIQSEGYTNCKSAFN